MPVQLFAEPLYEPTLVVDEDDIASFEEQASDVRTVATLDLLTRERLLAVLGLAESVDELRHLLLGCARTEANVPVEVWYACVERACDLLVLRFGGKPGEACFVVDAWCKAG